MPRAARPLAERFFEKVDATEGCWQWTGGANAAGYGRFSIGGNRLNYAHRWCWEFLVGEIPSGMTLDHLCRNKRCVNPAHLEVVSNSENTRRANPGPQPACGQGHSEFSYYLRSDGSTSRVCRPCKRAYDRGRDKRGKPAAPLRPLSAA